MSHFTANEIAYFRSQRLGRLATVNKAGEPHVVPVSYRYNAELDTIDIGGHNLGKSKKVRDIQNHPSVAFVVDDVPPPWQARGVEIRGKAEVVGSGGHEMGPGFAAEIIRIHPTNIVSWGIDSNTYQSNSRKVQ